MSPRLIRIASVSMLLAVGACSSADEPSGPPAELEQDLQRTVLANGLEVVVVPHGVVPVVTAVVAFRSGAFIEAPEQSGYSHLLEHMMFKGSADVPDETEFRRRLRALGIQTNGFTSVDSVSYYGSVPRDDVSEGLELLAGALRAPLIDAESVAEEIEVVLAEYDLNDADQDDVQERQLSALLFPRYPNRKSALGDRDAIAKATPEALRTLYERYYVPNNALLVLSGDIDADAGFALAKQHFSSWRRAPDPFADAAIPEQPALERDAARVSAFHRDASLLRVAWQGPDARGDTRATLAAQLLQGVTTQSDQQFRSVVGDPVIGAALSFSRSTHTGTLEAWLYIRAGGEQEAIVRLRDAIPNLARSITNGQLEAAKDEVWLARFAAADDSQSHAFQIANDWAFAGLDYHTDYLSSLYAVTREDVADVIESYIVGQPKAAVLAVPDDGVDVEHAAAKRTLEERW